MASSAVVVVGDRCGNILGEVRSRTMGLGDIYVEASKPEDIVRVLVESRSLALILVVLCSNDVRLLYRLLDLGRPMILAVPARTEFLGPALGFKGSMEGEDAKIGLVQFDPEKPWEALSHYIVMSSLIKGLMGRNVVVIGRQEGPEASIRASFKKLFNVLNIDLKSFTTSHFLSLYRDVNSEEVRRGVSKFLVVRRHNVSPGDIDKAYRLYLAAKSLISATDAVGIALSCSELQELPVYLALSFLASDGIPAMCGNDLAALISQVLLSNLSGKPPAIAVPTEVSGNRISFSLPYPPFTLGLSFSFVETGKGAQLSITPREGGTATALRLLGGLDKLLIIEGRMTKPLRKMLVSDPTVVSLKTGEDIEKHLPSLGGPYYVLGEGSYSRQIEPLSVILGIREIVKIH